jgi:mono/diheme cytochrome c family protein
MSRRHTVPALALLSMALLVAVACGGSSQAPADQAKPAASANPPAKTAGEILKTMDDHFARVREIEEAAIRGDLEAMKAPALAIAQLPATPGLPAGTDTYVADMKRSAGAVAAAMTVANAATATAAMVATCGTCHTGSRATPSFPDVVAPVMIPGTQSHMLMHQFAVDLMYQGLAIPSDDQWRKGAEAMKASPLADRDLQKDAKLTKEVLASEARVHEIADRAIKAADQGARIAIYGEVIGGCASCHGLHGRMWGPGLPKTGGRGN